MTIFDDIRRACARVADMAADVSINHRRLEATAQRMPADQITSPDIDDELHWTDRGTQTVAYVVILDAVNFGSGYFENLRPVDGRQEYELVAGTLRDRFENHGPISAAELAEFKPSDCARLFGQTLDEPDPRELMTLFAQSLRQLGRFVIRRFDGDFTALVAQADHRASRLVELLGSMPMYRDVSSYADLQVPLYKRAQITVADLHLSLGGRGLGQFEDIDELTMFADNQVPHVLRCQGVLEYSESLADLVDSGQLLPEGSRPEIEIRACAVHAVERITEVIAGRGIETTPMYLDQYLWGLGETPRYRRRPRHRTKTTAY